MELRRIFVAMVLVALSTYSASAEIRIYQDPGGLIDDYVAKFETVRSSGERVVVDGVCSSACTMLLGAIPRDRICVTARARFGFHSAWRPTPTGFAVASTEGNRVLWANYPRSVRQWITKHGGLTHHMLYLRGRELAAMYPACS